MKTEEEFWASVLVIDDDHSCWEWQRALHTQGYGLVRWMGKMQGAHRVAWVLSHGTIDGLDVLHRCDNPPCVRPDHLFLGNDFDNQRDSRAKGRGLSGEKHHFAKLEPTKVLQIKALLKSGQSCHSVSRQLDVPLGTIKDIKSGRTWRAL